MNAHEASRLRFRLARHEQPRSWPTRIDPSPPSLLWLANAGGEAHLRDWFGVLLGRRSHSGRTAVVGQWANGISLIDGQKAYLKIGAMDVQFLNIIRPPRADEQRAVDWSPFV